ncbi:ABC transporter ATP-binding protein [Chitinibacteraceae bacterium HSL-7]
MCSDEVLISAQGVSKCFHIYERPADRLVQMLFKVKRGTEFWAVKDVSVQVRRGEAVAIIGRNGSGKSTFLQMVCGTLQPTTGEINVRGRVAALLELGAGFNPEYTGRENVYFAGGIYGLSEREIDQRFSLIEEFAGIGQFIDQPVKTYSSGMFVRLAFALIAHVDADVLVVDEALAVGDVFFTQKCMRFIREFLTRGALLFVSHDTNSVMSFCREAVWLDQGQVKQAGSAKHVCEKYLEDFYAQERAFAPDDTVEEIESVAEKFGAPVLRDSRQDFVVHTNLRTEYELGRFSNDAASFGVGGGKIAHVDLCDDSNRPLSWVIGGERVKLRIVARTDVESRQPIVGFVVRNKNGQHLFGDNTCLHSEQQGWIRKAAGEICEVIFCFTMPVMPAGDYVISVAFADGVQEEHVVKHWIHDALAFKSHANSLSSGLVGIPMIVEMR